MSAKPTSKHCKSVIRTPSQSTRKEVKSNLDEVESLSETETIEHQPTRSHTCRKNTLKKDLPGKKLKIDNALIKKTLDPHPLIKEATNNREGNLSRVDDIGVIRTIAGIPSAVMPGHFVAGKEFDIGILNIHSPYKFWFYLEEQRLRFMKMQNQMDCFYNECDASYKMQIDDIKENNVAAFKTNLGWKRVVILQDTPQDLFIRKKMRISVFEIDYGEIALGFLSDFYFLAKDFGELPRQSYRGRLALVSPDKTLHWKCPCDTKELNQLTQNILLRAKIYAYEIEEHISHLILYIVRNEDRCASVQKIFAHLTQCNVFCPAEEVGKWPFPDEVYPTFDMLEKYEYPTLDDMIKAKITNQIQYGPEYAKYFTKEYKKMKVQNFFVNPNAADGMLDE